MTAHDLLSQLRARGVDIRTSGDDRLVIDAPRGTVTDELRTALSANKAGLIQLLKDEEASAQSPVDLNNPPALEAAPPPPPASPAKPASQSMVQQTEPFSSPMASFAVPKDPIVKPAKDDIADSTAEEVAELQVELTRLRNEESARRAEVDAARITAEDALRSEQARWQQQEEEMARRRA